MRPSRTAAVLLLAVLAAALLGLGGYAAASDANHTGLSMTWFQGLAVLGLLGGASALAAPRAAAVPRWVAIGLVCLGLALLVEVELLERAGLMMSYEAWVARGMPPRP